MCGIFGYSRLKEVSSLEEYQLKNALRFMCLANEKRGKDSTGIAVISKKNNPVFQVIRGFFSICVTSILVKRNVKGMNKLVSLFNAANAIMSESRKSRSLYMSKSPSENRPASNKDAGW